MINDRLKKVLLITPKSLILIIVVCCVLSQIIPTGFAETTQGVTGIQSGLNQPQSSTLVQKNSSAQTAPVLPAVRTPCVIPVVDFLATGALSETSSGPEAQTQNVPGLKEIVTPPGVTPPPETSSVRTLTLGGTKTPGQSIWISSNGGRSYSLFAGENPETTWSASVNLVNGANDFSIVAANDVLNTSDEVIVPTITYSYTVAAPTVTPPPETVSDDPWIVLSGMKTNGESIQISSNGGRSYTQLVPRSTATMWSSSVKLENGTNYFTVFARDKAGHPSAAVAVPPITYTVTAPSVTPPPATVTTHTVTLSGSKIPGANIWISTDGGRSYKQLLANDISTTWSVPIGLVRGDNHFTILAEDAAGNPSAPVSVPVIRCTAVTPAPGTQALMFIQGSTY